MSTESQLLFWWFLFGGTHILGSSVPVRARLIRSLGLMGFKGLYSIVALATFLPLVWVAWHHRHAGKLLFVPGAWNVHATEVLMFLSFLFLALAFASPNPVTTTSEMSGRFASSARGVHRITRHPMNTAFALFGLAHMLSNPTVGDWIFWGGFVVYALVSAWHQDRRSLATGPAEFRTFHAETSYWPFAAILRKRQRFVLGEIRLTVVLVAVVLFGVLRWLHPRLIGGFGGSA